jgi:hypothetical protein
MSENVNHDNNGSPKVVLPLPSASSKTQEQWHSFCAGLLLEIERLRGENDELREQRQALAKMVPIPDDVRQLAEKSFEEIMAMCEGPFSIAQVIREFEQSHGS